MKFVIKIKNSLIKKCQLNGLILSFNKKDLVT